MPTKIYLFLFIGTLLFALRSESSTKESLRTCRDKCLSRYPVCMGPLTNKEMRVSVGELREYYGLEAKGQDHDFTAAGMISTDETTQIIQFGNPRRSNPTLMTYEELKEKCEKFRKDCLAECQK